jgi:hypothetical protein
MPRLSQRYNNEQQADTQLDVIALNLSHISSPLLPLAVIVRKNSSDSNPYRLKTVDISRTFQLGEWKKGESFIRLQRWDIVWSMKLRII